MTLVMADFGESCRRVSSSAARSAVTSGFDRVELVNPLEQLGGHSVASVRQHAAEACTGTADPIELGQRDLRLGPVIPAIQRHTGMIKPGWIAGPTLGQKQPQASHDRHFARGQRQRHQSLTVGVLAQR